MIGVSYEAPAAAAAIRSVVELQDGLFGPVRAVLSDVIVLEAAALGLERLHNVVHVVPFDPVQPAWARPVACKLLIGRRDTGWRARVA